MAEAEAAKQLISNIGKQLAAQKKCPNKDFLVKMLRQAASAFPEIKQLSSLKPAIKPLGDSLVKHSLLRHKDKDVRLLVAICFCEIIRILAPNPDFSDAVFRDIFELFLSMFMELGDTTSPYFSRRLKLLETVAKLEFCVLMLDTGSEELVLEMFSTFFNVVREHHPQNLVSAMSSIMTLILKEKVSEPLLHVILQNLLEAKDASPASFRLAVSVIQNCSVELEPPVCGFLTSCILNRDAVVSDLREFYHEIILEIFRCAPQMLIAVIPNLTQELLTDQVDVRIKALNLIGKLFALPGHRIDQEYRHLFIEFLNRFSDKSAEVRRSAILCAKTFYFSHPSGTESIEVLTALESRLLDFDDKVRMQAVTMVCDLARSNLKSVPTELVSRAAERLRDKKVSVRKKALQKLLEVYQDYCNKCSGGVMTLCEHFEQIPCKILMLCYDKDHKEFGPQIMEHVLAEDLFPAALSIEERTKHWVFLFSLFTPAHVKALDTILYRKRRLQTEMQIYLALRKEEEEKGSEEVEKRIKMSFVKMSASFPDPAKAEECFQRLHLVKDNGIFNTLVLLLDEVNVKSGLSTRDNLLRKIGDRHSNFGFLQLLSTKCLFNIFSSEHVCCILNHLSRDRFGHKHLEDSSVKLLLIIISALPSLLRGSEEQFRLLLLEEDIPFNDELLRMLAKAGRHISIKLSDIYSSLERVCLEGTRAQSKLAVSAIAALVGTSGPFIFSELNKTLLDALQSGQNIPTVLQSLGCVAQHSVSMFETLDRVISQYVLENCFEKTDVEISDDQGSFDETSECSISCKLKIFGLKALVKSFLPHQSTPVSSQINKLLEVISHMLHKGDIPDGTLSCETDKAHIRLAAAKSVLRLSRRWDLHISPQIFRLTILMAKDPSSLVRRLFVDKTYKLLKAHAIPSRYACTFAFAASDSLKDLQEDSLKYMAEFIKEYSREARIHRTLAVEGRVTDYPVYIVVFLVHVLAHDTGFPPQDCEDEEIYASFCSPLVFTLQALVNASFVDGDMDLVNSAVAYLQIIFNAIKRAEDAVDAQTTPKLHILAKFGFSILNALNHSAISISHFPNLILMPSSLYKTSLGEKREVNLSGSDEYIAKKMVHSFESHISRPASSLGKRGRKCLEDSSMSGATKCSMLNLASCKNIDLSMNGIREQGECVYAHEKKLHETLKQEVNTRGRQKQALSSSPSGSVGLHNEFSLDDELDTGVCENSEPVVRNEQLPSSCNIVAMKPSAAQKEDMLSSASLNKNDTTTKWNSIITVESSKFSRANHADLCSTKENGNWGKRLIGKRIKLWSSIDKCYHSGTVHGFNSRNSSHRITYDNGEVEVLSLERENWETICHDLLLEKGSSSHHLRNCDFVVHSSVSSPMEMVDTLRDDASQQIQKMSNKEKKNVFNRKLPLAGKQKRGEDEEKNYLHVLRTLDLPVYDPSEAFGRWSSEVIDINQDAIARRTRRQKI